MERGAVGDGGAGKVASLSPRQRRSPSGNSRSSRDQKSRRRSEKRKEKKDRQRQEPEDGRAAIKEVELLKAALDKSEMEKRGMASECEGELKQGKHLRFTEIREFVKMCKEEASPLKNCS